MIDSEKVEIFDFSGEKFGRYSVPCSVILSIILLLGILNFALMIVFPNTLITTCMSLGMIGIFVLYYYYVLAKNPGKIRKFSISLEEIEILVPETSKFRICWNEFEKIEVKIKNFNFKPYVKYGFHFINGESEKAFSISLFDFPKSKVDQMLILTKTYAAKLGKSFTAVKEKHVSGLYLVENLKI